MEAPADLKSCRSGKREEIGNLKERKRVIALDFIKILDILPASSRLKRPSRTVSASSQSARRLRVARFSHK
jgi:hypothetical protein